MGFLVDLCATIFKKKNDNPTQYSEASRSMLYALYGVCSCTMVSQKICYAAVETGIIPVFTSVLSQRSYLEDLNANSQIMNLFQMMSRILHNISQVEALKHEFDTYNCCEILINMIAHTNNRLLRAINFLTVSRIIRDGIHTAAFTSDDSSTLFRLYYESKRSKEHEAYGLKQDHILNGFYAIGQLDCIYHD